MRSFPPQSGVRPICGINTNQFFLSDDKTRVKVYSYNLLVNNGDVLQLPTNRRPTIIERNGRVSLVSFEAKGKMEIGVEKINWVGSASSQMDDKDSFIAYGSFNIGIDRVLSKRRSKRIVNKKTLKISCRKGEIIMCFGLKGGKVRIVKICQLAKLQNYLFLLKGNSKNIRSISIGDIVTNFEIDKYILSGNLNAVSCVLELPMTKDKLEAYVKRYLLPSASGDYKVLSKEYIKSWSVIVETESKIIFFINDSLPGAEEQRGLNIFELHNILLTRFNFTKAFVCDAGQSSKMVLRQGRRFFVYGNRHYLKYSTKGARKNGFYGRKIPSALIVYK